MQFHFNANEIFDVAKRIEVDGSKFYRAAAESCKGNEKANKFLLALADMENHHRMIFSAMQADLAPNDKKTSLLDPDDQTKEFLKVMADGVIFGTQERPLAKIASSGDLEEIIKTAIGLEKDSVLFYQGIKEMVPEKHGRSKIEQIIREEMSHIIILNRELVEQKRTG